MEVGLALFVLSILMIFLIYLYPLGSFFLNRKRVKITYITKFGLEETTTLYLKNNDPLWQAVRMHRREMDE